MSESQEAKRAIPSEPRFLRGLMYDSHTGEEYRDALVLPNAKQWIVRSKAQRNTFLQKLARSDQWKNELRSKRHWVACFIEPIRAISPGITTEEAGAMLKLIAYMTLHTQGTLVKNGVPLDQKNIAEILGLRETRTREVLRNLVMKQLLSMQRDKTNIYVIQPKFHLMGKHAKRIHFVRLYTRTAKTLLPRVGLQAAGALYKLMPFMHYQSFHLCRNPHEELRPMDSFGYEQNFHELFDAGMTKPVQCLSQKDIASILGVDRKTVYRWTKELTQAGLLGSDPKVNAYYMRPDLFTRQDLAPDMYANRLQSTFDEVDRGHLVRGQNGGTGQ